MYIKDIAKIICVKGTASENTIITLRTHINNFVLWKGPAKELIEQEKLYNWMVVELLIDHDSADHFSSTTPSYNYDKIITVI